MPGSLPADRAEASPAHRSADPEPPLLASLHYNHPLVLERRHGADRRNYISCCLDAQTYVYETDIIICFTSARNLHSYTKDIR